MGGLGNQIFQIFTTITYSIKSKNKFQFLNIDTLGEGSTTIRNTFWKTFFSRLNPFLINKLPQPMHVIREKNFTFNELPIYEMIGRDVMLFGYFQSYKYFKNEFQTICRIIDIYSMKNNLLKKINYDNTFLDNTISLHFRIGDYKKIQEYHPIMTKEYYLNALNLIKQFNPTTKFNVMFFCEESDIKDVNISINFLKDNLHEYNFIRGDSDLDDWEQMLLMSCCHHNIIANSSFSLWGALFNFQNDKIVCYPSKWFGDIANHDTKDLCPNDWFKIYI
jgi:hypothetical protein